MRLSKLFRQGRGGDPAPASCIRSTSRSHVGRFRTVNEDRIFDRPDDGLWAIADGMGGHADGGLAAEIVIAHLDRVLLQQDRSPICSAIEAANGAIFRQGEGKSGTTVVVMKISDDRAQIWWVGDSRAYLIRDRRLELLTRDHSLVQELVEAGEISPDQAEGHPRANIITRALGTRDKVDVERRHLKVMPGDLLLLCSDGLSRSLASEDFRARVSLQAMADRLLKNALERDGRDNISLVLIGI